jgi:mycothiol conjugate amidase Mca
MIDQLTVMTVHAHPDDEVFATGGVLAKYSDQGINTVLVTCTDGSEGEIVDPTMNVEEVKPRLAEIRKAEVEAAAAVLGVASLEFLGYRDSGMAGTDSNQNPASFHMADPEQATERLVRLVRKHRPQVLVSYDEKGSYGHPDHIKAHQITAMAFDAAGDADRFPNAGPAWQPSKLYICGFSLRLAARWQAIAEELHLDIPWLREPRDVNEEPPSVFPAELVTTIVDVAAYAARKRAALACHRTQISPDFFVLQLPDEWLARAFADEEFIRAKTLVDAPLPEDDLFAGLR